MISSDYTWSEADSYIDRYGNVFAGFFSPRSTVTLLLDIKEVKRSFQMENDSLRIHYLCPTIDGHFGQVIDHQLDPSIKGKPITIDKWQVLKIRDVRAIDQWLREETINKLMEKYE